MIDLNGFYAVLLLALRMGPAMFMTPIMATGYLPGVVKGLMSLGLAAVMVSSMNMIAEVPLTFWAFFLPLLSELLTGFLLAFGVHIAFGALAFAGRLLDTQIGLGMAGMLDPLSKQAAAVFGVLLNLLAVAYVFAIDGHYMLLRTLVFSVQVLPLGQVWQGITIAAITAQFGVVFSLGLMLFAPVLLVLFLVEVGIALMARSMPQFNAFLVSIPAKIGIGLTLMAVFLPMAGGVFERWFQHILLFWEWVLS